MKKKEKNKTFFYPSFFPKTRKGYMFTLDAFFALVIILGVVLFIKPPAKQVTYEESIQEDLISTLSSISIGEIDDNYAQTRIASHEITNLNQSVLDQIGEFYANGNLSEAKGLADSILRNLNINKNFGLYFDNEEIYHNGPLSQANAESIVTSRQIISGIQNGSSAKGFSARAFLFSDKFVDYFYFGGYIGDGNITANLGKKVIGASIEGAFSGPFSLYINNQFVGNYSPTKDVPYKISLAGNESKFVSGDNNISFKSTSNLYIAGGYIRVTYNNTELPSRNGKDYFPGIDGFINLYQGFYIPSTIERMEIFLHYNSTYDIFLALGNKTIYEDNSGGKEINVTLLGDDKIMFDYTQFQNKTVPLRLGLSNASYIQNVTIPADVISVNDISGSMGPSQPYCVIANYTCAYYCESPHSQPTHSNLSNQRNCTITTPQTSCSTAVCGGNPCTLFHSNSTSNFVCLVSKLDLAKNATQTFIDMVLNSSGNRVGLTAYSTSAYTLAPYSHNLSTNNVTLKGNVSSWNAGGGTCICCGINRAVNQLLTQSNASMSRSIVIMSDGAPTYYCRNYSDYDGSSVWGGDNSGGVNNTIDVQWAINAACAAWNNYSIRVYAIGFGKDADMTVMTNIASCGQGSAYPANVSQLESIYRKVAQEVINAAYQEQTITGTGFSTKLFPDSYIHIDYNLETPYGLLIATETENFGNNITTGSFNIPSDSIPYEAKVVSYSSSKWTSRVEINTSSSWSDVFNLNEYGTNFTKLGDPYFIYLPKDKLIYGNNTVRVRTGVTSGNYTGGSNYDKVVYSVIKNLSAYSPILSNADGCTWNIEFEDGSYSNIPVPSNYSGGSKCYYNSSIPNPYANFQTNDAISQAVANLFYGLDLNLNGKVETKLGASDFVVDSLKIEGIPYTWSTEVQTRVWR